jgi:hypothetical protein
MYDDEKCLIGSPCENCIETCSFRKTFRLDKGADEKENKNERTAKESKGT